MTKKKEVLTLGQKAADVTAKFVGSWTFLIAQTIILIAWVVLNVVGIMNHWDAYPFILMNLVLSMEAAFTAPIIMMSQNRQTERDRADAQIDYQVNLKSEEMIITILNELESQNEKIEVIYKLIKKGKK